MSLEHAVGGIGGLALETAVCMMLIWLHLLLSLPCRLLPGSIWRFAVTNPRGLEQLSSTVHVAESYPCRFETCAQGCAMQVSPFLPQC